MPYASIPNHLNAMAHYLSSFIFLFIIFPRLIFRYREGRAFDNLVRNFIKAVLLYIVCGYLLVVTKLYEFIALVLFMVTLKILLMKKGGGNTVGLFHKINCFMLDFADGGITLKTLVKRFLSAFKSWLHNILSSLRDPANLLLLLVCLCSLYIRIYGALIHPAPSMSDSSVVLAWMKYIENRMIFHDGIYPQGFHIYLATLRKFSAINPLYVLNYSGPVSGLLTTLGIYYFTSRITESKASGIVAATVFGLLWPLISDNYVRQAATNSQEFAFAFIMPTFYYYIKYLSEGKRDDLFTAFAGITVIGLVHSIALAFCGAGAVIIVLIFFVTDLKRCWKRLLNVVFSGLLCIFLSFLPLGLGLLFGKGLHASSSEYLLSKIYDNFYPPIRIVDIAAFAALGVAFLFLIGASIRKKLKKSYIFVFLYGAASFLFIYYGPALTKSQVITNRFGDMWNLFIPVLAGVSFHILFLLIRKTGVRSCVQLGLSGILFALSVYYTKLTPIVPYKVQSDTAVEQYLRIDGSFRPTEWHLVSGFVGGYALSYGTAYHIESSDFVANYDPANAEIRDLSSNVLLPNIFIFYEKNVFIDEADSMTDLVRGQYEARLRDSADLGEWIEKYKEAHGGLDVYYEDADLVVYYIKQGDTKNLFKNQ